MKNIINLKARWLLAISLISVLSSTSYAEEVISLDTIVTIGQEQTIAEATTVGSIDVITKEELDYEHVNDTLELFNKVPGVYIARYNQGIINTDIGIRGYAADGTTPHAKLLIDGIPANFHNGYNELDQIFPGYINSIDVFKGTSDPRYGLFNIAGNYNVNTRQDVAKELEVTYGTFNSFETQGYAGFVNDNLTHNYAFGYRKGDGYRDNTDLEKLTFAGSWAFDLGNDKELRFLARHAEYDGDSPGYLTNQQAQDDPRQSASFASEDGGDKTVNHLSVHWSQPIKKNLDWTVKAYRQNFERTRWVRFSEAGTLRERFDDQAHWGAISTLNWDVSDQWDVDFGFDYESQDVIEQRFNTINNLRERDPNSVRRNHDYEFNHYGAFVQLHNYPTDALRWNIALRADRFGGDFTDVAIGEDRDIFNFGTIVQPKFNIIYSATDAVNLFANAGRSFQHPIGSAAYTSGDRNARDVSVNKGFELGAQFNPAASINARLSYWQQNASDEFILFDGIQRNVGKTERKGFDLSFNGKINQAWSYWGSFTTIDSEIVNAADGLENTIGNELRSIPSFTSSLGLNYQVNPKLVTRLHLDSQGDYYVNENNEGGKFGDFNVLNIGADYKTSWGLIKAGINNLTNERYEYVFDFSEDGTGTIHSPSNGINANISVSVDF